MGDRSPAHTIILLAALLVGAGVRAHTAVTSAVHGDEAHFASDACWLAAPLPFADGVRFLRTHPHVHVRLDPATGARTPWPTTGRNLQGAHLSLHAWVTGPVMAALAPPDQRGRVLVGRMVNVAADSATILLLPRLVALLGGSPAAGLLAAGLYAVFPPAIIYGSISNLDPFLAPLLVLLLVLVLPPAGSMTRWALAGAVSGLLLSAKHTGLLALIVVPILGWRHRGWRHGGWREGGWREGGWRDARRAAAWGMATLLVVVALVDPLAYLGGMLGPHDPYVQPQLRLRPLTFAAGNLSYLAQPSSWYWLSYSYHGRPLAPDVAVAHHVLTAPYLVLYVLALPLFVRTRRWRVLAALYLPVAVLLAAIPPSNGLSRFHLAGPLVCGAVALALAGGGLRRRAALLAVAALAAAVPLMPARLGATGSLDLGDLLRANPRVMQPQTYYSTLKGRALRVHLAPGTRLVRRLWLRPGRYVVTTAATGPVALALDGRSVQVADGAPAELDAVGWVHRLELSSPLPAQLTQLALRRLPP